ncbi:MAG: gluconate 2-dehydrogenase subunit 3 family protein, partial [Candidatus Acidiferrales bacterium]
AKRREFLVRAATGAGAVASAGLVPAVFAGTAVQPPEASPAPTGETGSSLHANAVKERAFFNQTDAETIAAFTERILPGAADKPGALEAGVLNYIDLALSGAYSDLQYFYRMGLDRLEAHCQKTYGKPFVQLGAAQQDDVLTALEEGKASEFTWPSAREFFNTLRTHTMEGMFADPVYGGNKDFAGWELVGFPGAQMFFSPKDMGSQEAFTRSPIIGLQSSLPATPKGPARKG